MCVCVCTHVYIYVYMCTYTSACGYVCVYLYKCIYIDTKISLIQKTQLERLFLALYTDHLHMYFQKTLISYVFM